MQEQLADQALAEQRDRQRSLSPEPRVLDVRVEGARQTPVEEVLRQIRTRAGRPFDPELIQEDVRRLYKTRKFVEVNPRYEEASGGRIVIFALVERPVLKYVKYVGCKAIPKSRLEKESGVKPGDALDPFSVEEGRRRIEELYKSKGFNKVQVTVVEGSQPSDLGAIYYIDEGPKQRVSWTCFVGNRISTDARLRTKIQSKPGLFWIFKGELNRKLIEEDRERLTDYYRSLGFYRAKVSALPVDPTKNWQLLTFVIDEGPRYRVRNVSFIGNQKFSAEELAQEIELKPGEYFSQSQMQSDQAALRDKYGAVGHIFNEIEADIRLDEERPELDLVYNVKEGEPYHVGKIEVDIRGDNPHTQITTVLNRLSLYPGDLVDIRELRASERRLKASGLFEYDPMRGISPQIVVRPPDMDDDQTSVARQPKREPRYRGQSPDDAPHVAYRPATGAAGADAAGAAPGPPGARPVVLSVEGRWAESPQPAEPEPEWDVIRPDRIAPSVQPPPQQGAAIGPERRPDSGMIVRGQYSADAGTAVPSLPRTQPWAATPPATPSTPPYSAYPPAAEPTPTPSSAIPQPEAAPSYGPAAPASRPQPSPSAPVYSPYAQPYTNPYPATGPLSRPAGQPPVNPYPPANTYPPASAYPPAGPYPPAVANIDPGPAFSGLPPSEDAPLFVPLNPELYETQTGRLMFSVGVNSEAGLMASLILDEQNFDWTRFPTSWEDIRNGTAWRGGGQRLRIEAVPGTEVQRYTVNFQEPYFLDSQVSLGLSGYFYNRWFREWDEERLGGRVALGYQFTHDLSGTIAFRGEKVEVYSPIVPTPAELTEALGSNALYGFRAQLAHDTRDNSFLATEGHYFEIGVEQVLGSFTYTRGDLDVRRYFLLRQHPDGSGRHVLSLGFRGAVTSDDTPIYEHYFAGGFSTIRGFDFRGASHLDPATGVRVGGHFMMLASAEYMFPITADDNLRAVVFCDTGTTEPRIDDWTDRYRVAPGIGLRIVIPAMGPAPIALDFAFPVSKQRGDEEEVFSFFIGFMR